MAEFKGNCLPVLIGSVPMRDHGKATEFVMNHTPEIPLWVQLPAYKEEGMIAQFLPGLPGVTEEGDKTFVDTKGETFDAEILAFYEEYLMITEAGADLMESRFALTEETARGFFEFLEQVAARDEKPLALKGQITGPVTFATGVTDRSGRAIFYDDQARDVAVKHLSLKAKWQTRKLAEAGLPVIVFFDEPALAGFGSSAFLTVTKEMVQEVIGELTDAVHAEGGLAGVHVCANTEWDLLLDSTLDIISFDAYSYFDRFILYADQVKKFLERGGIIASGIVPTSDAEQIEKETAASLAEKWEEQVAQLEKAGISRSLIMEQTLITPSCGTGSLSLESATKVLEMTRDLSAIIRKTHI